MNDEVRPYDPNDKYDTPAMRKATMTAEAEVFALRIMLAGGPPKSRPLPDNVLPFRPRNPETKEKPL